MKVSPLLVASALLFGGVSAFAISVVVHHRQRRAQRPSPVTDEPDVPPLPRRDYPAVDPPPPPAARAALAPVPTGTLRVHVTGPLGLWIGKAQVWAGHGGDDDADPVRLEASADGRGLFAAELPTGLYQLRVTAPGLRDLTIDDAPTGDEVVEARLQREPLLLGAVGALGDGECGDMQLTVDTSGDEAADGDGDDDAAAVTDRNDDRGNPLVEVSADGCTFAVRSLPDRPFTVVASGGDRTASVRVTPPDSGDPPPICLAPPCLLVPAVVVATLGDSAGQAITQFLRITAAGQTITVRVASGKDRAETTTSVGPGVSEALLTLPARSFR